MIRVKSNNVIADSQGHFTAILWRTQFVPPISGCGSSCGGVVGGIVSWVTVVGAGVEVVVGIDVVVDVGVDVLNELQDAKTSDITMRQVNTIQIAPFFIQLLLF